MSGDILFDNILITDNTNEAEAFAADTFDIKISHLKQGHVSCDNFNALGLTMNDKLTLITYVLFFFNTIHLSRSNKITNNPAPAAAGAAHPKNQGNREERSAIYATVAVPIFDHIFFALPREVPVSNCFNGLLRALMKNSLEDRMSKFHLVKKWWDFENRDFGV